MIDEDRTAVPEHGSRMQHVAFVVCALTALLRLDSAYDSCQKNAKAGGERMAWLCSKRSLNLHNLITYHCLILFVSKSGVKSGIK